MPAEPYPLPRRSLDSLDLSVRLSSPGGGWVEVNDGSRANLMKMGKILQG